MTFYLWKKDNACLVVVPELPDCMANGNTIQQAIENVDIVIAEWTLTAKTLGIDKLVVNILIKSPPPSAYALLVIARMLNVCPYWLVGMKGE